jgi:hypothetical protein
VTEEEFDEFDVDEGADAADDEQGWGYRLGQFIAMLIAIPLLLVFAALVVAFIALVIGGIAVLVWAVYHADPGEISPDKNAGWIELIVSNRWVLWGLRAGVLGAVAATFILSLFVVMSIVVRARRGEWLRSGAGLQADIQAAQRSLEGADSTLIPLLAEAQAEKAELARQLAETNDLLNWVLDQQEPSESQDES